MDIIKYCKISEINWSSLPELASRIENLGYSNIEISISLNWYPDRYSKLIPEKAIEIVNRKGQPSTFDIDCWGEKGEKRSSFSLKRIWNMHNQELLIISTSNVEDEKVAESIITYFGLEVDSHETTIKEVLNRTAFIAYRFDEHGESLAFRLTRFLELLGFKVTTGRAFSPKKVSQKVEERISKQSIFFVILTEGQDDTWLTQEPTIAKTQGKPIFLLKESHYEYNSGIFADQEFIPFDGSNFEKSYIQIMEGLRELNLLKYN